ncbi:MAG: 2-hydroxyacid dehydrogenase [Verrucomicrobiota bacterium]
MKIAFFSTKPYDERFFNTANQSLNYTFQYFEPHLNAQTASLAKGCEVACAFVNDTLDKETIEILASSGIRHIALRCAGYNQVDLKTAEAHKILVSRVPAYSPHAVAEHTLALMLALNRKVHRAHSRIREGNFALDGLLGYDIYGLTAGIIGTGKIGINVVRILQGFGCEVLAYDPYPNSECEQLGARYVSIEELLSRSHIVSLHCPLTPESHHLVNDQTIAVMKDGVTLINTSRGGLIDTPAVIRGLKSAKIGYLGLDVYEEESDLFFEDLSNQVIQDDIFARLTTFPNVIITGHQAFFTGEAFRNIADTTLANIREYKETGQCNNCIHSP